MNFLVVGVGYTGKRVLSKLPKENSAAINRSSIDGLDRSVVQLNLDHDSPDAVATSPPYRVIYTVPPSDDSLDDIRLSRFLGRLKSAPDRFVYISTSGVYGDCAGALVNESMGTNATMPRAIRRVAAEELLTAWCEKQAVELVVLRVPAIYGPGRLGSERLLSGTEIIVESEAPPGNRIHVDDLATACTIALTRDIDCGIYNISDGDFRSASWFALTVAKLSGISQPPQVTLKAAEQSFSEARLSFLRESRKLDNRKMLAELELRLLYADPEAGIRASLKAQG